MLKITMKSIFKSSLLSADHIFFWAPAVKVLNLTLSSCINLLLIIATWLLESTTLVQKYGNKHQNMMEIFRVKFDLQTN